MPELILWYTKLFRLNAAERPTDALSSVKECSSDAFPNIFTLINILLTLPVTTSTIVFHITQTKNVLTKHKWYHSNEWTRITKHL